MWVNSSIMKGPKWRKSIWALFSISPIVALFHLSSATKWQLVFDTFDQAVAAEPTAHPLFHSDRGFQYTSKVFCTKLKKAKMKQSMSRVARCTDNGPMEASGECLSEKNIIGESLSVEKVSLKWSRNTWTITTMVAINDVWRANTDPSSSRIINGSLITSPLGQANRINCLTKKEASRAKLRLNKVKT